MTPRALRLYLLLFAVAVLAGAVAGHRLYAVIVG